MHQTSANKTFPPLGSRQAGIGFIEILVAIVVLSIGVLGVAALQTRSMVSNGNAMQRSMATVASYSIIAAMSADRQAVKNGDYNGTVKASKCPTDTGSFAQTQLKIWCNALGERLGDKKTTQGEVNCDDDGKCKVTISWKDTRSDSDAGGGAQQLVTVAKT